jgi:putative oxidoreductase
VTAPPLVRDVLLLITRVAVGLVFFAHGWQKLFTNGVDGTAAFFGQNGVPAPQASAWVAALLELVGGALLVVGLAVPVVGILLLLDMLGAYLFVHSGNGLFVAGNGYELVLVLGAAALVFVAVGPGRYSLDHVLFGRRRNAAAPSRPVRV